MKWIEKEREAGAAGSLPVMFLLQLTQNSRESSQVFKLKPVTTGKAVHDNSGKKSNVVISINFSTVW